MHLWKSWNIDKIRQRSGEEDPLEWLKNYVSELNKKHKEESLPVIIRKNPNKIIEKMYKIHLMLGICFYKIFIIN